ncbi:MAG TPA: hypothetical protein DEB40_13920 [Elusimicrobia bacterium]|nr:hypothetical protein [Elusimicrobiota bacterium]HBT62831.1 hypothetical protein [Elusimicrobiota bacterium]
MIKYVLFVLALAGACHYGARYAKLDGSLKMIHEHRKEFWAPRANYYVAVVYDQQENYAKSQEAFSQLLTDYPTCQYVPRSLIYLSEAAENNRDWETVKSALNRYVDEFAQGPDVNLARRRLDRVKYQHGP